MKILDILNSPWAIVPDKLFQIQEIYGFHIRREKIDLKEVEAAMGKSLQKKEQGYEVVDGVALIPVDGVIGKKMNLFSKISGGVSTQLIARDLKTALDDPAVDSIILVVDSPGGTVDGTQELATFIYENRGKKPISAVTDGMIASAAYWIASAASDIYISSDMAQIGSIGVVATHTDYSKMEEKNGMKTTEITAGKYKRIASQYAPLSDEGKQYIQDQVDYIYTAFVNDVARNRNTDADTVLNDMADGRIFTGKQAITAGLVDGVSTLDGMIEMMKQKKLTGIMPGQKQAGGVPAQSIAAEEPQQQVSAQQKTTKEESIMTLEQLKAQHPDIYQAAFDEGKKAGVTEGIAQGTKEGAEAERKRIQGVYDVSVKGHEETIKTLMFDGVSDAGAAALAIVAAEKKAKGKFLAAYIADGNIEVPAGGDPNTAEAEAAKEKAKKGSEEDQRPLETQAKEAWDGSAALRAEFVDDYDRYLAYRKAESKQQFKVLKK